MSILRLGAYKLPAAEVVLVQTLLRLFAHDSTARWQFSSAPPYDALLVDGSDGEPIDADVSRMARAVLRLTRMNAPDAADTLQRPIRPDRLQEWLKATEHKLLETRPMDLGDVPMPSAEPLAVVAERVTQPTSLLRFKLRRWPPTGVLRGDPTRIRMATLLSRRALSAAELARMSGNPPLECQTFLQLLQTTGLAGVQTEVPAPAAAATPTRPAVEHASASATSRPSFGRGLIAGIRRRLGVRLGSPAP